MNQMPTLNKKKHNAPKQNKRKERQEIYQTTRWRQLRLAKLLASPLCEVCLQQDKVTPAVDVHHKISFLTAKDYSNKMRLAYDYDNLMAICKTCHAKEHNHYLRSRISPRGDAVLI